MGRLCGKRKAICSMTTFLKRSGAALLSLVLLCVLAIGAGAASSQTVGVKFWKERSDKESMANSGIDADRTIQHWELSFRLLHGGTMLFFLIGQVAVRLNHQVDVFLDPCPA